MNGNRRAMRVGAFPKNPTRRWRYQNKTIVLFFMDSSMKHGEDNVAGLYARVSLCDSRYRTKALKAFCQVSV